MCRLLSRLCNVEIVDVYAVSHARRVRTPRNRLEGGRRNVRHDTSLRDIIDEELNAGSISRHHCLELGEAAVRSRGRHAQYRLAVAIPADGSDVAAHRRLPKDPISWRDTTTGGDVATSHPCRRPGAELRI